MDWHPVCVQNLLLLQIINLTKERQPQQNAFPPFHSFRKRKNGILQITLVANITFHFFRIYRTVLINKWNGPSKNCTLNNTITRQHDELWDFCCELRNLEVKIEFSNFWRESYIFTTESQKLLFLKASLGILKGLEGKFDKKQLQNVHSLSKEV